MKNPFGSEEIPGSYMGLQKRMLQKFRDKNVTEQVLDIMLKTYESALASENIVLSRPERKRLLAQISKQILEDVSKRLSGEDV
jgi:hypothetical protein